MKIAQVVYGIAGGGAPNLALSLLEELTKRGHEVHLICVNIPYNNEKESTVIETLNNKGVKTFRLGRKPGRIHLIGILKLIRLMYTEKYDIIHSHLLFPDLYSGIANLCFFNRAKHVITVHNSIPYHSNFVIKTIFRKSNFVRCSPAISPINSVIKDRTIVNGINLKSFEPKYEQKYFRKELNLTEDDFIIVSIGNLRPQKNQILGLELISYLINSYQIKNIHYVICGHGPEEQNLKRKSIELDIHKNVHFVGLRNDVSNILSECNLFVNFSLWEGLPLAVIEAYASGITVLLSPIDEHKVIYKNVSESYLTENLNVESFALSILSIYKNNKANNHELTSVERVDFLRNYSVEECTNSYENLFKMLKMNK